MNNKKGGFGAKVLLVLVLMIASAVAGAYGYRVLDAKMAVKDATKEINNVDLQDYDSMEANTISEYEEDAIKDLETATSREQVYEILTDFHKDVSRVQTKAEKEAAKAIEEAKKSRDYDEDEDYKSSKKSKKYDDEDEDYDDDDDSSSKGLFKFNSADDDN